MLQDLDGGGQRLRQSCTARYRLLTLPAVRGEDGTALLMYLQADKQSQSVLTALVPWPNPVSGAFVSNRKVAMCLPGDIAVLSPLLYAAVAPHTMRHCGP
jgi:hypothetical protein